MENNRLNSAPFPEAVTVYYGKPWARREPLCVDQVKLGKTVNPICKPTQKYKIQHEFFGPVDPTRLDLTITQT